MTNLRFVMSLDSIINEYVHYGPVLFFFYKKHIYDALLAIISNYSTRQEFCQGTSLESYPLIQICADLDNYIDREYAVNALPREIDNIVLHLQNFVLDDLLGKIGGLFGNHLGDTEFKVMRCNFLPGTPDIVADIVLYGKDPS